MAQDLRAFLVSQAATMKQLFTRRVLHPVPDARTVITEGNQWALSVERRTSDGGGSRGHRASER